MRNKLSAAKNFVARRKTTIVAVTTLTVCAIGTRQAIKQHDEFLKEKGLYDEFYNSEA